MTRLSAILIGATIFASVYGGALANEHRSEPKRSIPIEYVSAKTFAHTVSHVMPKPKSAREFTAADLKSDQRTLYYALLSASDDAVRKANR